MNENIKLIAERIAGLRDIMEITPDEMAETLNISLEAVSYTHLEATNFLAERRGIMDDCLFCKIIRGEIPSDKVYEDEMVLAFNDIDKKAPVHILVIPKKHVGSLLELGDEDAALTAHIMGVIQRIAKETGVDKSGFRVVVNTGDDGGQTVHHLHFHILGGRSLEWPPG